MNLNKLFFWKKYHVEFVAVCPFCKKAVDVKFELNKSCKETPISCNHCWCKFGSYEIDNGDEVELE